MSSNSTQQALVLIDQYLEQLNNILASRDTNLDELIISFNECCEALNELADQLIHSLTEIAADYSATYNNFICQQQDNEVIDWIIEFSNYKCQQEVIATTTSTTEAVTTTTTVDPEQVDWEIVFSNYKCQLDPDITYTTTPDETVVWSATYENFICGQYNCEECATTTTTTHDPYTTTTTPYVDPEDVTFSATYINFICGQTDNPLIDNGITTTTTFVDEDDVDWEIVFSNYKCQLEYFTTTTTTAAPVETTTTTTEEAVTTTTTLASTNCGTAITGSGLTFPEIHWINVEGTGTVYLTVDTIGAPDRFEVYSDGVKVLDTGYCGDTSWQVALYAALAVQGAAPAVISSPASATFSFIKTSSNPIVIVKVYAPLEETEWSFTLGCTGETTTTTESEVWSATYENFICATIDDGQTTTTTELATTTTTTAGVPVYEVNCGATVHTGGQTFPTVYIVIGMGAGTGYVTLTYDTVEIPDRFVVEMDGLDVIDTGYRGDVNLQSVLNTALAGYGESPSPVIAGGSGTATFFKSSSSTIAVVKVWAPIKESLWSFSLSCPDAAATTTSTTPLPATTTTTTNSIVTTTTTTEVPTTTTTTNTSPISIDNVVSNSRLLSCATTKEFTPADFTFSDADGDDLTHVKIVSYTIAGSGSLKYNGTDVTTNQIIPVYGGAAGSFLYSLIYTPDASVEDAYADTIEFLIRTANNENYG